MVGVGRFRLNNDAVGASLPGQLKCLEDAQQDLFADQGLDVVDGGHPATQPELNAVTAALAASGTINTTTNPVDWTQLKNVPAGFADGTDAGGPATDHGLLTGLTDDDHPQYLVANGSRNAPNGFAVTGTAGSGSIPATGTGVRLMWYPRKSAFRAGAAFGNGWDDASIGTASVAMGALPASVLRMILRQGTLPSVVGILIGIVASTAVGGLIQTAIPGTGGDVFTYLLIVPVVVAVVMLAAYIPARRAAHVDPLVALRQD